MTTIIKGQPTSAEIRERLRDGDTPVAVAFSGGKDSIAATLALQEAGVDISAYVYFYSPPGQTPGHALDFVEAGLQRLEQQMGIHVHRYPHVSLYRQLNAMVFQPPERFQTMAAAKLPEPTYEQIWSLIKQDLGLPQNTWVADGVRAADSPMRRGAFTQYGLMKPSSHKVSPVADWLKAEVMGIIERHHIDLPGEYEYFGRSFDGIDYRFLKHIKAHYPADYEQILTWFPLADLEIFRRELALKHSRNVKELPL